MYVLQVVQGIADRREGFEDLCGMSVREELHLVEDRSLLTPICILDVLRPVLDLGYLTLHAPCTLLDRRLDGKSFHEGGKPLLHRLLAIVKLFDHSTSLPV